jgi:hypothetical protein
MEDGGVIGKVERLGTINGEDRLIGEKTIHVIEKREDCGNGVADESGLAFWADGTGGVVRGGANRRREELWVVEVAMLDLVDAFEGKIEDESVGEEEVKTGLVESLKG